MTDVVNMLDAFEAKRKRTPESHFLKSMNGKVIGGFYVRATLPDGTVERVEGFSTEGAAAVWIKNEPVVSLHNRKALATN